MFTLSRENGEQGDSGMELHTQTGMRVPCVGSEG